jgi:hypothetical protein
VLLQHRGRDLAQLFHQFIGEALPGERQVVEFLRVGHAAGAVPALYQRVLGTHLLAGHVLGWREAVLDDLEHEIVGRQRKHRHHHALDARRDNEFVSGAGHVPERAAVVIGLAVLVVADRAVNLRDRFGRHQLLQKQHALRRDSDIHQEIGAGKTEQHADHVRAEQDGIHVNGALLVVQDGQHDRHRLAAGEDPPHQIGTLVAKEVVPEYLELGVVIVQVKIRREPDQYRVANIVDIPLHVLVRNRQRKIPEQVLQQVA